MTNLISLLVVVAALSLAACGSGRPQESAAPAQEPEVTGLPDVARVLCERDGTRIETSAAKPQRDGIHLKIVNETGEDLALEIGESQDEPVMGTNADRGTSIEVLDLAPGTIWLRCTESRATSPRPDAWAPLEIVDEDDVWLEGTGVNSVCESTVLGTSYFGPDSRGYPTPAAAVREQFADAFEPGDVLEQLGYPEESTPTFSLVRDGVSVWGFELTGAPAGGWLVDSDSRCEPAD